MDEHNFAIIAWPWIQIWMTKGQGYEKNYFEALSDCAGLRYLCPSWHLLSFLIISKCDTTASDVSLLL